MNLHEAIQDVAGTVAIETSGGHSHNEAEAGRRVEAVKAVDDVIAKAVAEEEAAKAAEPSPEGDAPEAEAPKPKPKPVEEEDEPPPAAAKDDKGDDPKELQKKVKRILRDREEAQTLKGTAKRELEEARAFKAQVEAELAQLRAEREWFTRLKASPEAAFKAAGWDPEAAILEMAKSTTAEGQLARQIREQAEKMRLLEEKARSYEEQTRAQQQEAQQRQLHEARARAEQQFLEVALADDFPALKAFKKAPDVLLTKAHRIADEYRAKTGGREASFRDIAEYLNDLFSDAEQATASKAATPAGGRGKGSRTITQADQSERRSVPRPMTGTSEELRAAAIEAANAAIAKASRESAA